MCELIIWDRSIIMIFACFLLCHLDFVANIVVIFSLLILNSPGGEGGLEKRMDV